MSAFNVTEESVEGGPHVLAVEGYVDFEAAPQLKRCLTERIGEGHTRLIVDLSAVGFIDSTAIGVLVAGMKRLRETGGSLAVVCPQEHLRDIFEIAGLNGVMPLHRSRDDALGELARAA